MSMNRTDKTGCTRVVRVGWRERGVGFLQGVYSSADRQTRRGTVRQPDDELENKNKRGIKRRVSSTVPAPRAHIWRPVNRTVAYARASRHGGPVGRVSGLIDHSPSLGLRWGDAAGPIFVRFIPPLSLSPPPTSARTASRHTSATEEGPPNEGYTIIHPVRPEARVWGWPWRAGGRARGGTVSRRRSVSARPSPFAFLRDRESRSRLEVAVRGAVSRPCPGTVEREGEAPGLRLHRGAKPVFASRPGSPPLSNLAGQYAPVRMPSIRFVFVTVSRWFTPQNTMTV
ncbi:hypothetical protein LX32DRAFT_190670 [Colletotrichum zoysiae]|uniref:Uncharacterized protein n=1 Tax=Colletotrichum zoysiae TaxID=1216348 RepID=A0AAD9H6L1_9PEZI|nr:hypothetical protein LX32DRAFT_190670 [Colletotrichum zoysiae]